MREERPAARREDGDVVGEAHVARVVARAREEATSARPPRAGSTTSTKTTTDGVGHVRGTPGSDAASSARNSGVACAAHAEERAREREQADERRRAARATAAAGAGGSRVLEAALAPRRARLRGRSPRSTFRIASCAGTHAARIRVDVDIGSACAGGVVEGGAAAGPARRRGSFHAATVRDDLVRRRARARRPPRVLPSQRAKRARLGLRGALRARATPPRRSAAAASASAARRRWAAAARRGKRHALRRSSAASHGPSMAVAARPLAKSCLTSAPLGSAGMTCRGREVAARRRATAPRRGRRSRTDRPASRRLPAERARGWRRW